MRRFPGSGAAGWRGRAMLAVGKTGGHHMRRCTGLLAGIFLLFIAGLAVAQTDGAQAEEQGPFAQLPWEFGPTTGTLGGRATIDIPEGYAFLDAEGARSEEHTSELQSLMTITSALVCCQKKT